MTKLKPPSKELDNINIKIRIESLKSLINLIKVGIGNSKKAEETRIKCLSEKIADEDDLHELRTEKEIFELEYVNNFEGNFECSQIENTSTYSIIPSCYMMFETNLTAFAKVAQQYYFLNLKYNELMGGKTEKIKKYLKKLANIDISKINSWNALKDLEVIRNCIVHNDGKVNEEFRDIKKIKPLAKKYGNNFSINKPLYENEQYLIIKFSLCYLFMGQIESFFDDLIEAFGFNQNFYFGSEASQQILKERINAKVELDNAIKQARKIYGNRMKLL